MKTPGRKKCKNPTATLSLLFFTSFFWWGGEGKTLSYIYILKDQIKYSNLQTTESVFEVISKERKYLFAEDEFKLRFYFHSSLLVRT